MLQFISSVSLIFMKYDSLDYLCHPSSPERTLLLANLIVLAINRTLAVFKPPNQSRTYKIRLLIV